MVVGREPDDAERARTLAAGVATGSLATVARDPAGTPFASVAPFGLDRQGRPVLCISELAEHTQNLHQDPRCSILVAEAVPEDGDPLAAGRVTLLGTAAVVPAGERDDAKGVHLAANPYASYYIDYTDFALWRIEVEALRFVGGYGRMSWVDPGAWAAAEPDPVAPLAAGVVEHMNDDHAEANLLIARVLGGRDDATSASCVGVDRYGIELVAKGTTGTGRVRVGFEEAATTSEAIRAAVVALVHEARAASS
ncbi:MAG: DUF2470 domain-containing protein [Acidimicrobiia bacterium]|nr:DUF2470 domain-containing protein [Acidimicrobiia bacterium]